MSKKTSLYNIHTNHGAKMVEFAGYQMPIQYKDGIIQEHKFTRENAGIFDVSHMGQLFISGSDEITNDLEKIASNFIQNVKINIEEVRKPEINAQLVSESIASQLERRVMYRRAMKRAVQNSMRLGALGVKVNVAGRLNGAEIARSEWYREGRVPLHTIRAKIDYGFAEAKTTYGIIGIKTWIFNGESVEDDNTENKS